MISRILVALDFSPRSARVFDAAADIASRHRATLFPFHVIFVPPEYPPAGAGTKRDPLPAHAQATALDQLRVFVAQAPPDLNVAEPIVRIARQPWRAIIDAADEHDVDLIVIGSHGYHGLDRVLGTTAGKVVNHAHRNVFVVHERAARS